MRDRVAPGKFVQEPLAQLADTSMRSTAQPELQREAIAFRLTAGEVTGLRSQTATSDVGRGGRALDLRPREGYLSFICSPLDQPSGLRRGFVFRSQARRTEIADLRSQSVTSNLKRLAPALGSQFEENRALEERIGQNLSEPAFVQAGREGS